jgi:hypothetical protein
MLTTYLIRDWPEQLCRKGEDNPTFEFELYEPALVWVEYHAEDDGEGGKAMCIDSVRPMKPLILDGGAGPGLVFRAGAECLPELPPRIVQEMRETIVFPEPEFDFAVEL